ncbi:MAG: DUF3021 family protein [Acutalibacteraceae bacterium]
MKIKIKNILHQMLFVDFTSFSIVSVILALSVYTQLGNDFTAESELQLFLCTTIISVLTICIAQINRISWLLVILLQAISVEAVIIGIGGFVFSWFPITFEYVAIVTGICIVAYILTLLIWYFNRKAQANKINEILTNKGKEM